MKWKDKYNFVDNFYEGRARAELNNKYGHVNLKGKITTPIIYDNADDFYSGRAKVRLNNKWGIVNLDGQVIKGHHNLIIGAFS